VTGSRRGEKHAWPLWVEIEEEVIVVERLYMQLSEADPVVLRIEAEPAPEELGGGFAKT